MSHRTIASAVVFACSLAASAAHAQLVLYENDDFSGRSVRSGNTVQNLGESGFNDRASSIKVFSGQWQVCSDAYFGGKCVTIGPGEYPTLRAMGMVGSRAGAPILGSGGCSTAFAVALSPAAIISFPAPATSNVAGGFPALRSPVCFVPRVMGPIQLRRLSAGPDAPGGR
jgi:hypothetical protein